MAYDPEGPVAKQLVPLLVNELTSTFNIPDDAQDTADFINVLIGQNRTPADICGEVKEVVNIPIDEAFMGRVYTEISRLELLQGQPEQPQQPEPVSVFPAPAQSNPFAASAFQPSALAFPTGPAGSTRKPSPLKEPRVNFSKGVDLKKSAVARGKGGKNGISKDYVNGNKTQKKSFGMQNTANLQKALALATDESMNVQPHTHRPPKGRCKRHPHCQDRECRFAHPFRKCFLYPNCPNGPGQCDFLHPSEDQELMQEIDKNKPQWVDRNKFSAPQITLCKFGVTCSRELCPFGHPTPANQDAKVIVLKWCKENKKCQNPDCKYGHSSPNYQAPPPEVKPTPPPFVPQPHRMQNPMAGFRSYAPPVATTLEQCKYGQRCTDMNCTKRHAMSSKPCREGANCTKMTCTFAHPLDEPCRFGDNCRNRTCPFTHPDGRAFPPPTMSRTFAVGEDQVMEQAAQE